MNPAHRTWEVGESDDKDLLDELPHDFRAMIYMIKNLVCSALQIGIDSKNETYSIQTLDSALRFRTANCRHCFSRFSVS